MKEAGYLREKRAGGGSQMSKNNMLSSADNHTPVAWNEDVYLCGTAAQE